MPERIQLSRKKGWRMPPNTVKVDRSSRYGNPFKVGDRITSADGSVSAVCFSRAEAVETFRTLLSQPHMADWRAHIREKLRGKNLACWCPLDGQPCHADVLLEIANA
jgi:hypothetical protein